MEFDEINRILDIVREHELSEFELEREGFKIRIKKGTAAPPSPAYAAPIVQHVVPVPAPPPAAVPPPPPALDPGSPAPKEVEAAHKAAGAES